MSPTFCWRSSLGCFWEFWWSYTRLTKEPVMPLNHMNICILRWQFLTLAYNRLQDQYEGLREQHFTDIGILDNLVDRHVQEIGVLQGQITGLNEAMRRLREGHNELQ